MKKVSLDDLACPSLRAGKRCYGQLELNERVLSLVQASNDSSEVLEGMVCCQSCGEEYPILCGVLFLVNDIRTYLARHYSEIMTVAAGGVSKAMGAYLQEKGYDLHDTGYQSTFWTNALGMGLYICAHYDNDYLAKIEKLPHPLRKLIQTYCERDFHAQLVEMATPVLKRDGMALDIGCNVGGMSWRLAESGRSKLVYGIDISFRAVLTARRILLGQPEPMTSYRLYREGLQYDERPLPDKRRQNCELLLASGLDLPFKEQSFDFIHCANVLDVIPQPERLLEDALRVLKGGGGFLLTDPYVWSPDKSSIEDWFGTRTGRSSAAGLRELLEQRFGCAIKGEEEQLVWILRVYDRYFSVYLTHCILVEKAQRARAD